MLEVDVKNICRVDSQVPLTSNHEFGLIRGKAHHSSLTVKWQKQEVDVAFHRACFSHKISRRLFG